MTWRSSKKGARCQHHHPPQRVSRTVEFKTCYFTLLPPEQHPYSMTNEPSLILCFLCFSFHVTSSGASTTPFGIDNRLETLPTHSPNVPASVQLVQLEPPSPKRFVDDILQSSASTSCCDRTATATDSRLDRQVPRRFPFNT